MGQLDYDTWQGIRRAIKRQARRLTAQVGVLKKSTYGDTLIATMYFWCVLHDRPLYWAAQRHSYQSAWFRPRKLPSRSQFGRRVDSARFRRLLEMIDQDLRGTVDLSGLSYLDGKPLTVGPASVDPEAKRGHIMGGFAKGYKLHLWADARRKIACWCVDSLNVAEPKVAEALVAHMPLFSDKALVLADANYDTQGVYEALAARNAALLSKPRGMDLDHIASWAQARHPKSKPSRPIRREALEAWKRLPGWAAWLYKDRIHVEGTLSNLCSFAGGLGPLDR